MPWLPCSKSVWSRTSHPTSSPTTLDSTSPWTGRVELCHSITLWTSLAVIVAGRLGRRIPQSVIALPGNSGFTSCFQSDRWERQASSDNLEDTIHSAPRPPRHEHEQSAPLAIGNQWPSWRSRDGAIWPNTTIPLEYGHMIALPWWFFLCAFSFSRSLFLSIGHYHTGVRSRIKVTVLSPSTSSTAIVQDSIYMGRPNGTIWTWQKKGLPILTFRYLLLSCLLALFLPACWFLSLSSILLYWSPWLFESFSIWADYYQSCISFLPHLFL